MATTALDRSVVVVGAGLAGARTVSALRAAGHRGRLTVLGAEGVAPYDRPPLSKELFTRTEPAWLSDELGIDLTELADEVRFADRAVGLDRVANRWRVSTDHGEVTADAVVLAVGAEPLRPWPQAQALHTATDAARLRDRLATGRVVVVGAGWIGAEIAGVAAGAGAAVTVVEADAVPLMRPLGPVVGAHLAPWFEAAGVELRTDARVAAIAGAQDGAIVELVDGSWLAADVVLAAVGARPATGWLAETVSLDPAGSIRTDRTGRVLGSDGTPGPTNLWAVGDCATREHPGFGLVPGGHWSAALHDPEPTAAAILGLDDSGSLAPAPYVFSRQLGHDLALFGLPRTGDKVALRGDPRDAGGWVAFYLDAACDRAASDGTALVRAILSVDSPRETGVARRLLATGPTRIDLTIALDPSRHLRDAEIG